MTPASPPRDRYVDLLRVAGVAVVVLGHWAVFNVEWADGVIRGVNALTVIPAIRPVTWLVQVMPLLFFIGGFANARALEARGGSAVAFLRDRLVRLLAPTAVFIVVWTALGLVQAAADLPEPDVLRRAADVAALPFWFLGIYLVAVGLAPATRWLHRRLRWWVPAMLAAGALAVDVVSRGPGAGDLGALNYVFVWLLPHQLGFFYADGTLPGTGRRTPWVMAAAGLAGMVALVSWFGYPVSMVEVPGEPVSNTAPPSIGLVFLTLWLVGLVLAGRGRGTRWLEDDRRYRRVAWLNSMALTAYLWHVTAITAAVAVLYPLGFPQPGIGTPGWWALRPVFVAAMVPILAALMALFRRFETHPFTTLPAGRKVGAVGTVAVAFGVFSLAVGLLGFGITGFIRMADPAGVGLLVFRFNPVQNLAHLLIGGGVAASGLWAGRWAGAAAVAAGAALFLAAGLVEAGEAATVLGMNSVTAVAHLVAGSAAAAGLVAALGVEAWAARSSGSVRATRLGG